MKNEKVIGYCRVSTENQKKEGTIELQEKCIQEYASNNNLELVKMFCDNGVSGSKELENRPGLAELFIFLEENKTIQKVVIYKLDRLARDLYIQEHIIKKLKEIEIELFSIEEPNLMDDDPIRKAFRQFLGIISELEKSYITMRLSSGRKSKAQRGGYAGGSTALGYITKNKILEIDPEQSKIIKKIFYLRRYKKLSYDKIAKKLNFDGVPTARGGQWYAGTVQYMLKNPIYRGKTNYNENTGTNKNLIIL